MEFCVMLVYGAALQREALKAAVQDILKNVKTWKGLRPNYYLSLTTVVSEIKFDAGKKQYILISS